MWQVLTPATYLSTAPVVTCRSKPAGKSKPPKTSRRDPADSVPGFTGKLKKEPLWQCVKACGACCKLNKGPAFASPEEIFDDPSDIQLYQSMTGSDGWCIHYEKSSRTCSIYDERPYFCRAQPDVFQTLYGIKEKNFNKAACSACKETIKSVYGASSKELENFKQAVSS